MSGGTPWTSGPWSVSQRASRRVTTTGGVIICNAVLRNSGSAKRGIRSGAKEQAEAEANARLIAASPELVEAIKALLQPGMSGEQQLAAVQNAKALLTKIGATQ